MTLYHYENEDFQYSSTFSNYLVNGDVNMLECSLEWESSKRNHTNAYCMTTILGLSSRVTGSLPSGCLPIFGWTFAFTFFVPPLCHSFRDQTWKNLLKAAGTIRCLANLAIFHIVQPFFCKKYGIALQSTISVRSSCLPASTISKARKIIQKVKASTRRPMFSNPKFG